MDENASALASKWACISLKVVCTQSTKFLPTPIVGLYFMRREKNELGKTS